MASRTTKLLTAGAVATSAAAAAGGAGLAIAARRLRATGADDDVGFHLPPGGEPFAVKTDDGTELAGVVCGDPDGPDVLLTHCWMGSRAVWGPVAQCLCDTGHRVVLYDHRGHGESTFAPGTGELTMAHLGSDVAAVIDQLDLSDVVIAGHSMGGMAAQAFAIDHRDLARERVRGLVLVSTAGHGIGYHPGLQRTAEWAVGNGLFERFIKAKELGLLAVRGASGQTARLSDVVAMRELVASTAPDTRVACLRAMHRMDLRAGLAELDIPVTVVSGSRDGLVPPALSRALADAVPGARFESIPGGGHMLPLEEPDHLAELIAAHHRS